MNQKMAEKPKEVSWKSLTLDQKKEYDEARANELSNVLSSAAVRALSKQELQGVDPRKVMGVRWVLTWKASGKAKARLVVLGYQARNLTEVAAAPTLSRVGETRFYPVWPLMASDWNPETRLQHLYRQLAVSSRKTYWSGPLLEELSPEP